jgi:hypothetical protein
MPNYWHPALREARKFSITVVLWEEFSSLSRLEPERCTRSGYKKKWPWNMMHDMRRGIVFGTRTVPFLVKRSCQVGKGIVRKRRGGKRDEFWTTLLMILEHSISLKKISTNRPQRQFELYLKRTRARLILLLIHRNAYLNETAHH